MNHVIKLPIGPKTILLNNRYQTVKLIGKGSFGKVFQSLDFLDSHKTVAVKVLMKDEDNTFEREIDFFNIIGKHDSIIELKNSFIHYDNKCLVFEKADCCLRLFLHHNHNLNPSVIKLFISQIARGLHHIHSLGFIHSDLKPDNIVVFRTLTSFQLKLIDFGCVRKINEEHHDNSSVYFTTRWFRAPEIVLNHIRDIHQSSDVWAVGCILFQMITNKYLFLGVNNQDMLNWFQIFCGKIPLEIVRKNSATFENYYITEDDHDNDHDNNNTNEYKQDIITYYNDHKEYLQFIQNNSNEVNYDDDHDIFKYNLRNYHQNTLLFQIYPKNLIFNFEKLSNDFVLIYLLKNILLYNPYERINCADIFHIIQSNSLNSINSEINSSDS